jgi:DNA invertase Pin-like site-specific DNA recombinase
MTTRRGKTGSGEGAEAPCSAVVAYTRVSTSEQADSGAGLGAQRAAIDAAAEARGWTVVARFEDAGISGSSLNRPGLTDALATLESGRASAVVVAKLDRLSRSLMDFSALMERARRRGWALVALDLGVDTTTPAGEMLANVLASFAQYERRIIGQRTKDALAEKRRHGVRLGRPRLTDETVVARIVAAREAGQTLASIADDLNADGVPTARGGRCWYDSTVRCVLGYAASPD